MKRREETGYAFIFPQILLKSSPTQEKPTDKWYIVKYKQFQNFLFTPDGLLVDWQHESLRLNHESIETI